MKVVLPMAGRGSRFSGSTFKTPKPLIPILGKPMFTWALESLKNIPYSELIVVALKEHEEKFHLKKEIAQYASSPFQLVLLEDVTEGQLCTVLASKEYINSEEDILVISSDTIVVSDLGIHIHNKPKDTKGIISVANMPGDSWSFARTNESGWVDMVTEKVRISNHASTGLYYFSNGREFVSIAEEMILNKEKTKGEFYVIPVYQKFITKGWRVEISEATEMWDMGTPESLDLFFKNRLNSPSS